MSLRAAFPLLRGWPMDVQRLAASSYGDTGGNPAGVVICEALRPADTMQAVAAEIGCSETDFAAPVGDGWRVRCFAPEIEVPSCGRATTARGAALATADGAYAIRLREGSVTVGGRHDGPSLTAAIPLGTVDRRAQRLAARPARPTHPGR